MSDAQITKKALADSMKVLMQTKRMDKISVSQITEGCNLNRQTFYYHFKDKYDLVNWIFYTEFLDEIKELPTDGWATFSVLCQYLYRNKTFYRNAFKVTGQNSFSEYFMEIIHSVLIDQLSDNLKDTENVDFYATFYADAFHMSIKRWLTSPVEIPPADYVKLLRNTVIGIPRYYQADDALSGKGLVQ